MFHNGNADWSEKGEPYNPKGYLTIDLEGLYEIDEFKVYGYWEDQRSFAYNISTSMDGITFTQIVDKKIDDGKNNISNGISPVSYTHLWKFAVNVFKSCIWI